MTERVRLLLIGSMLMMGAVAPSHAASLAEQLRLCAAEADTTRRLNCYDEIAAGLPPPAARAPAHSYPAAPASSSVPAAPAALPEAPATLASAGSSEIISDNAEFGVNNGPLAARRHSKSPKHISAVVQGVITRGRGELVVTLDNGQVWQQLAAVDYFPLRVGDTVEISSGALGSYILSAPSRRSTKVTRIR